MFHLKLKKLALSLLIKTRERKNYVKTSTP